MGTNMLKERFLFNLCFMWILATIIIFVGRIFLKYKAVKKIYPQKDWGNPDKTWSAKTLCINI